MFQLGKTIVSEDIIEKEFVCNLTACKGKCCIDGEAGAPLEEEELKILLDIYPKIKPFLRDEGIAAIEDQGLFITNDIALKKVKLEGLKVLIVDEYLKA